MKASHLLCWISLVTLSLQARLPDLPEPGRGPLPHPVAALTHHSRKKRSNESPRLPR